MKFYQIKDLANKKFKINSNVANLHTHTHTHHCEIHVQYFNKADTRFEIHSTANMVA